ncbi:hypothetical protein MKS88_002619 [Plasmodium brasilianum]|uniref:Uncharacterized protein n=1 Tax=Plasmodium brasilianum TaxID=5824 RepID=A0ACB9YBF6_PLABR|nr:hypothetical protein MKS88_002619 [Plasmodium brasilianum]
MHQKEEYVSTEEDESSSNCSFLKKLGTNSDKQIRTLPDVLHDMNINIEDTSKEYAKNTRKSINTFLAKNYVPAKLISKSLYPAIILMFTFYILSLLSLYPYVTIKDNKSNKLRYNNSY